MVSSKGSRFLSKKASEVHPVTAVLPKPRLDYRAISESIVYKSHNAFNRKAPLPIGALQSVARHYDEQKELSSKLGLKRHTRSNLGEKMRKIKDPIEKQAKVAELEQKLVAVEDDLLGLALQIPNDTHPEVPIGPEEAAVVLSTHGPDPIAASGDRDHMNVGRALGILDFEAGATVTGSSWYYLLGEAALLEMALTNYALSIALKHGFRFVTTPDVVRADIALRCGFQPRDQNADPPVSQMYHITSSNPSHPELVLSGTAEIPLGGMFANQIYTEQALPLKVVGLGRSFRAEAGARGADTRGLYRVHQFSKLELFVVCGEDASEQAMKELRIVQSEIFAGLKFPFRVLDMPTEELGASAYRKYDMEAWMPGRGSWGEISSTSNCTDYQSRRLHIRYRRSSGTLPSSSSASAQSAPAIPFAHTLNGTAAAIPRLIIALIENGARFDEEGKPVGIDLPSALEPFWHGTSSIIRWN
ncbi:uncharacterized protein EDB91DRAFT_1342586 [Suillus paluster]|uniref:uncharacterized protein n=1 Tax=Suillus paluster TaxID=48578 RepID=UPI001B883726|nr:uncharacterized protein EDB91DRAFT_1342586 [Suillus paluster]KAG1754812.1 hypothetical protein EDB91DRAFT_1342586 [Suillus paluster]